MGKLKSCTRSQGNLEKIGTGEEVEDQTEGGMEKELK